MHNQKQALDKAISDMRAAEISPWLLAEASDTISARSLESFGMAYTLAAVLVRVKHADASKFGLSAYAARLAAETIAAALFADLCATAGRLAVLEACEAARHRTDPDLIAQAKEAEARA